MTLSLTITVEEVSKKMVLRLDGRLDAVTTHILEKKLLSLIEEQHVEILLDFINVDYLSSAGLRLLLAYSKTLKTKKGALVLFSLNDQVMEIMKLAGFDRILLIFNNESEALKHFPKKS